MHSTPPLSALYRHLVPPTPSFGFLGLQNLQWKWRNGKGCCMWPMFYPFIPICGWKYFGKVFVVCWASAPSVRPWRQVDCGGRGSPPHTWTALCSVCILHCVNGALFWQYFENMISPLSALAVITDRQACLSHCNLDSWIGGRQCYLIIDSVWPIFISRDFWNFGPFFEPNR